MFLGLLFVAMAIGAAAAGAWLYAGGSVLLAVAIYSIVATFFVLVMALLSFLIVGRRTDRVCWQAESLHAAE
jgi:hypothetical protein